MYWKSVQFHNTFRMTLIERLWPPAPPSNSAAGVHSWVSGPDSGFAQTAPQKRPTMTEIIIARDVILGSQRILFVTLAYVACSFHNRTFDAHPEFRLGMQFTACEWKMTNRMPIIVSILALTASAATLIGQVQSSNVSNEKEELVAQIQTCLAQSQHHYRAQPADSLIGGNYASRARSLGLCLCDFRKTRIIGQWLPELPPFGSAY